MNKGLIFPAEKVDQMSLAETVDGDDFLYIAQHADPAYNSRKADLDLMALYLGAEVVKQKFGSDSDAIDFSWFNDYYTSQWVMIPAPGFGKWIQVLGVLEIFDYTAPQYGGNGILWNWDWRDRSKPDTRFDPDLLPSIGILTNNLIQRYSQGLTTPGSYWPAWRNFSDAMRFVPPGTFTTSSPGSQFWPTYLKNNFENAAFGPCYTGYNRGAPDGAYSEISPITSGKGNLTVFVIYHIMTN